MQLTLATYNIHAAIGMDGHFRPERIVQVLQEIGADVVALQEVEHRWVDDCDLLDYLARETGCQAIAGPTLLRGERHYGNALLTALPVRSVDRVNLSCSGCEPRGALDVTLDWEGTSLQVVATHLGLGPKERRNQVRRILSQFQSGSPEISVLMGDLNEWFLWGRILRWLHAYFDPTPTQATFPARWPVFALDRLWVRPHHNLVTITVHNSPCAREASDHLPLTAIIER